MTSIVQFKLMSAATGHIMRYRAVPGRKVKLIEGQDQGSTERNKGSMDTSLLKVDDEKCIGSYNNLSHTPP